LNYNSLFSEGNNLASRLASRDSKYLLLLNSDVQILRGDWLAQLLSKHKPGATSLGVVFSTPSVPVPRLDGYCFLIDKSLYHKFGLDEARFQWFWAITRLQANLLSEGKCVRGFAEHENHLLHFGGKSGAGFSIARGLDADINEIRSWFSSGFPILERQF
jgi:hypothetical protein